MRLGQDVCDHRRLRALVGTGHQDRLPRSHVWLHRRRDRPQGHRQTDLTGPSGGSRGPLGVADEFFFGVPESELGRLARLEEAEGNKEMFESMPEDSPIFKLGPPECTTAAYGNRADVLAADIPAGGTVTARAVARMYAALLDEVGGVRLISPQRLREVSAVAMSGVDEIFGFPSSWGLGYSIGQFMSNARDTQTVFGVGGVGGSHAYADTATGTTFALTKNRLTPSFDTAEQVAGIVTKAVTDS